MHVYSPSVSLGLRSRSCGWTVINLLCLALLFESSCHQTGKLVYSAELGCIRDNQAYMVDRSVFGLSNVVYIRLQTLPSVVQLYPHDNAESNSPISPLAEAFSFLDPSRHTSRRKSSSSPRVSPKPRKRPTSSSPTFSTASSTPSSVATARYEHLQPHHLYLEFPSSAAQRTWFALMQHVMIPSGQSTFEPTLSPTYRLKRKLAITICEARHLQTSPLSSSISTSALALPTPTLISSPLFSRSPSPSFASSAHPSSPNTPTSRTFPSVDPEERPTTFVELRMGTQTVGRTSSRRKEACPYFSEEFHFDTFGTGEQLEPIRVVLWRERKGLSKPVVVGELDLSLSCMIGGETTEGWFPLLQNKRKLTGELRVSYTSIALGSTTANKRNDM